MATLSLTKAGRLQERIRSALRDLPLRSHVTLGIFVPNPEAEVEREAAKLRERLDLAEQLLSILASLRATVGKANAEHGVTQLLAEKAATEEALSLIANLLPASPAPARSDELDDLMRSPRPIPPLRHAGAVGEQVQAMRVRYEQAERSATTVDVPLLDDAETERLRAKAVDGRRRLEEIGDRLRELNGSARVEIDDAALAFLREKAVI